MPDQGEALGTPNRAATVLPPLDLDMDTPTLARLLQSPLRNSGTSPIRSDPGVLDHESGDGTPQRPITPTGHLTSSTQQPVVSYEAPPSPDRVIPDSTHGQDHTAASGETLSEGTDTGTTVPTTQLVRSSKEQQATPETCQTQIEATIIAEGSSLVGEGSVNKRKSGKRQLGTSWSQQMAEKKYVTIALTLYLRI